MADEQVLDFTGLDHLIKTTCEHLNGKAPNSHASANTTYGVSTASKYGHAKASGTTPKAPGTATVGSETSSFSRGDHVHPEQVSAHGIKTAGSGAAYTATVEGITALTAGASFIMIPHTVSTSTAPTLNVNGLGAKTIRRTLSDNSTTTVASELADWLGANKPVCVTYNGVYWIADLSRPKASDIYGSVGIENGGHAGTTLEEAQANLGILTMDEIVNLHVWKKYESDPSVIVETEKSYAQLSWRDGSNTYVTGGAVTYADGVKIENGVVVLDGETSACTYSSASSDVSALLGKYVQSTGSSLIADSYDGIYYIPNDATLTPSSTKLTAANVVKLTTSKFLGYVASKGNATYPTNGEHTDGKWYLYHKQLGE